MLFSSSIFLFAFLPAVLLGYYVVFRGMRRAQNLLLLAASLLFYAWGEPWFVLVMMGSILANYFFGLWVHAWRRRGRRPALPVTAAVVCNLGLLFVFKYLTFTLENLNLAGLNTPVPVIGLPIGISFFTFQALSYVLDVAMGTAQVQRNPLRLGLYISLFPQLIAGPIVKYSTVADEIEGRRETWADFSSGCCRFIVGLGKKVLLSNQLAGVADAAWDTPGGELSAALAWLGALCYTLQIYYDFSGYSDMAIGLGQLFGFHFLENFNYPYFSRSVTEFWRRWHISLSTWFGTMCTSLWAEAGEVRGGPTGISSLCGCSPAYGTGPTGRFFAGASSISCCCAWKSWGPPAALSPPPQAGPGPSSWSTSAGFSSGPPLSPPPWTIWAPCSPQAASPVSRLVITGSNMPS